MIKRYFIYIMTNSHHTTLYIGVTSNLDARVRQHKEKRKHGFTKKYNVEKLVYFEEFDRVESAIAREKQLKAGSRRKKLDLIQNLNPGWADLSPP